MVQKNLSSVEVVSARKPYFNRTYEFDEKMYISLDEAIKLIPARVSVLLS